MTRSGLRSRVAFFATGALVATIALVAAVGGAFYALHLRAEAAEAAALAEQQKQRADALSVALEAYARNSASAIAAPHATPDVEHGVAAASDGLSAANLVLNLNNDDPATRVQSGQQLFEPIRTSGDAQIRSALILSDPTLTQLSASGRFNVLYMLNVFHEWPPGPETTALSQALAFLDSRREQYAIGAQTQDCIDRLRAKIGGRTDVGDRCGN